MLHKTYREENEKLAVSKSVEKRKAREADADAIRRLVYWFGWLREYEELKSSLVSKNQTAAKERQQKYREELKAQVKDDIKRREASKSKEAERQYLAFGILS